MKRLAGSFALMLSISFVPGCDSGDKKDDKKADASKGDKKKSDDKKADVKTAEGAADDAGEAKPAEPVKLATLDLGDTGLEAVISAPEGAKASDEFGAFIVQSGESFQLQINTGAADLAARKAEIEGNTVNKLKSFVTESETELVYETEVMGKAEFHFVAKVEIDGAKYSCEDKKGQAFTKADVDAMLAACTSLKAN